MNSYLVLDCETGGVTMNESLLTAYYGVLNENFEVVDELSLAVKPDDGRYIVTAGAMAVNKINLVEHDKIAIPYKQAKPLLYDFLKKAFEVAGEKMIPVGHGVRIDIEWTNHYLISQGSWETFVSYRTVDTSVAAQFLRVAGLFPKEVSGSLGSLVKHFGIESKGELHDARVDSLQTVSVLQALVNLVKGKKTRRPIGGLQTRRKKS